MIEQLVDMIYEAAVLSERWPQVLLGLCRFAECRHGFMFRQTAMNQADTVHTPHSGTIMRDMITSGIYAHNDQERLLVEHPDPEFIVDLDVWRPEQVENRFYFQEWLKPQGIAWGTGTMIANANGDNAVIALHRPYEDGPVPKETAVRLTDLRPHLARAAMISARVGSERAQAQLAVLESLGLPAAALGPYGRLRLANGPFDGLVPSLVEDRAARLTFTDRATDTLFSGVLATPRLARTFAVRGKQGTRSIGHLLPVTGDGQDIFSGMVALLVLVPVALEGAIDQRILQGLFDLSPAEARVARGLLRGVTVEGIAAEHGTSLETVRTQLKKLLFKTGTSRQAELVALLGAVKRPSNDL